MVTTLGGTPRSAWAIAPRDPATAAPVPIAIAPTSVRRDSMLLFSRRLSSWRVMTNPPLNRCRWPVDPTRGVKLTHSLTDWPPRHIHSCPVRRVVRLAALRRQDAAGGG